MADPMSDAELDTLIESEIGVGETQEPEAQAEEPAVEEAEPSSEAAPEAAEAEDTPAPAPTDTAYAERLAKLEERYDNLRSYADRTSGENKELRDQLARIQAKAEASQMQREQGLSDAETRRAQADLLKEWRKKIDDDPANAVDLLQVAVGELQADYQNRFAALEQRFQDRFEKVGAQVQTLDPEFQRVKDRVQELESKYSMPRESALKLATDEYKSRAEQTKRKPAQPGRTPAPGVTSDGQPGQQAPAPKKKANLGSIPGLNGVLRDSGLFADEEGRKLMDELAEELANVG